MIELVQNIRQNQIKSNQIKSKARKVRYATQHLTNRYRIWKNGDISFAELDASVKGWIDHAEFANSLELRKTVLARMTAQSAANQ